MNINIMTEHLETGYLGVYTYSNEGKKIGCSFRYTNPDEFCEKFGLACSAIARKLTGVYHAFDAVEVPDDNS